MRDPNRIDGVLNTIGNAWKTVPDWRFGQFIENLKRMSNIADLFYYEDDKLCELIKAVFGEDDGTNRTTD